MTARTELETAIADPRTSASAREALFLALEILDEFNARKRDDDAADAGISQRTLERAKTRLHVRSTKERSSAGRWMWELPEASPPSSPPTSIAHILGGLGGLQREERQEEEEVLKIAYRATSSEDSQDRQLLVASDIGDVRGGLRSEEQRLLSAFPGAQEVTL